MSKYTCTIKMLSKAQLVTAAKQAIAINPANAPAEEALREAAPGEILSPERLAALTSKYWGSAGVRLTVGFLDNPPSELRTRILSHMNSWGEWSNVKFVETTTDPQVRIARIPDDGYWSYLGTDVLAIPKNEPTMNLDSFTMNTPDASFYRVVRHETGHTLGFPHEHRRKELVERIDRIKAIEFFRERYGWSEQQTIQQVLTPMDNSRLIIDQPPDPDSIMCYWLPASIMKDNIAVSGGADINANDARFASNLYAKPDTNSKLVVANFGYGAGGWQVDKHPRFMADLTGDGRADIVGFGTGGVWVALNKGNGTFQTPQMVVSNFGYDAGGWQVDKHPRFLADLTGDGRADIVGFGNAGVWVALNKGNGTFQTPQMVVSNFGYDAGGWQVDKHPRFLADLTGDGRADIVGFGNAGVWVALNNGNGTFQTPQLVLRNYGYDAGGWRVEQHPRFLADLTGDRLLDIVGFGHAGVWAAINKGRSSF